jgi:hypothetical protein
MWFQVAISAVAIAIGAVAIITCVRAIIDAFFVKDVPPSANA